MDAVYETLILQPRLYAKRHRVTLFFFFFFSSQETRNISREPRLKYIGNAHSKDHVYTLGTVKKFARQEH